MTEGSPHTYNYSALETHVFGLRSQVHSSWYSGLHYEGTGNEKIIRCLCMLPRSFSS